MQGSATNQYPSPAGPGSATLTVLAYSGTGGLAPGGEVHAQGTTGAPMGEFRVEGPVTCVRVSGNKASIKYRFDQASGSAAPFAGGGVEVFVEDNDGAHGESGGSADANAFDPPEPAGVFEASAGQCDDPNLASYDTVSSGSYEVTQHAGGDLRRGRD